MIRARPDIEGGDTEKKVRLLLGGPAAVHRLSDASDLSGSLAEQVERELGQFLEGQERARGLLLGEQRVDALSGGQRARAHGGLAGRWCDATGREVAAMRRQLDELEASLKAPKKKR